MKELEIEDSGYEPLIIKQVPITSPWHWLSEGWKDFRRNPIFSMSYGLLFFAIIWLTIASLVYFNLSSMLLPSMAGAMLIGPILAICLYRASRRYIAEDSGDSEKFSHNKINGPQLALVGVVLMTLLLMWMRAATIIYALFFGLTSFPGIWETVTTLLWTKEGLGMLAVGTVVGGLFAAFTYAIAAFSIPMLLDQDVDGFTAMGSSFVAVNRNVWVMIKWGFIIMGLTTIGFLTGMLGLIVIFPVLGHATWHAYHEVFHDV